jgi:hypothetical protein
MAIKAPSGRPAEHYDCALMGLLLTTIAAGAVWIVLLSLGIKPFDALLVSILMIFLAATLKLIAPFMPWRSREARPGDGYMPR